MKKIIHLVFLLSLLACLNAQDRHLFINESFSSSVMPSSWTIGELGQNNWSISQTNEAGGEKNEVMLQHNPTFIGTSRLVTPLLDLTGESGITVSFKHCLDNYSGSHTIGIATTSDGGTTWTEAWSESYNTDGKYEVIQRIETQDIGKENVQFCIFYSGNVLNIDYWYFDDIVIFSLENTDIELSTIDVPDLVTVGDKEVSFTVINKGINKVTSIEASYQFENHDLITETFDIDISALEKATLKFSTPTFLDANIYSLTINIILVNGTPDDDSENNTMSKDVSVNLGLTNRIPMIEHFSSSTCSPCVNVNNLMATLTENNPNKFTYTKYPMDFPGSGDPYFTQDGNVRSIYYDLPWVPYLLLDGIPQDGAVTQESLDQHLNISSLVEIKGAFTIEGNTISTIVDIMAYARLDNVRAYISVNEKTTTGNAATNGETEFHHILMKMLDNANGNVININAGEYQRLSFDFDLSSTNVEDMNDLEVSAWLQNYNNKDIYNSSFLYEYSSHPFPVENMHLVKNENNTITATWNAPTEANPVGYNIYVNNNPVAENTTNLTYSFTPTESNYCLVEVCAVYEGGKTSIKAIKGMKTGLTLNENQDELFRIYPNPADNQVTISAKDNIRKVSIFDIVGKLIYNTNECGDNIQLNVADLKPGIYFILAEQDNGFASTQKIIVTH